MNGEVEWHLSEGMEELLGRVREMSEVAEEIMSGTSRHRQTFSRVPERDGPVHTSGGERAIRSELIDAES